MKSYRMYQFEVTREQLMSDALNDDGCEIAAGTSMFEGWAHDKRHGPRHYFRERQSLCGKIRLLVEPLPPPATGKVVCCRECFRRRVAESKNPLLRGKRT